MFDKAQVNRIEPKSQYFTRNMAATLPGATQSPMPLEIYSERFGLEPNSVALLLKYLPCIL